MQKSNTKCDTLPIITNLYAALGLQMNVIGNYDNKIINIYRSY
jgi:hypothetical protein